MRKCQNVCCILAKIKSLTVLTSLKLKNKEKTYLKIVLMIHCFKKWYHTTTSAKMCTKIGQRNSILHIAALDTQTPTLCDQFESFLLIAHKI